MPGYFSQGGQKILPPISSSDFSGSNSRVIRRWAYITLQMKQYRKKSDISQYQAHILLYKRSERISNTNFNASAAFFSEAKDFSCIPLGKGCAPFLIAE